MSDGPLGQPRLAPGHGGEVYSVGYGPRVSDWHERRTAADRASFILPHLQLGMALLDCGCGSGSITAGLAKLTAPGAAVGIDLDAGQVRRSRHIAVEHGTPNLSLCTADMYTLPFSDSSFDVVFAHNLLQHLNNPLRAMKEMRRVLKPGGIAAVRDPDYGAIIWAPSTPLMEEATKMILSIREHNGGSPNYARSQCSLLLEAGFARVEGFAFAEHQGTSDAIRAFSEALTEVLQALVTLRTALDLGLTSQATLESMAADIRAWARSPGAFRAVLDCAAIGWV